MTSPGLTFGEHCVKFSTLEIIFCVFVAENYLVKVLIPTYFPFIGVGNHQQLIEGTVF
jgi:hypothetical protein